MEWFVLVVLFTTPANLAPHVEPDFPPRTHQTHVSCEDARDRMAAFIADRIKNPRVKSNAFCVRVSVHGYLDGVDALRRMTGDVM